MDTQTFWNEIGSTRDFTDPFFVDQLAAFISKDANIVEYGCGYGRVLNILNKNGFQNIRGFDLSPNMIKRGKETYPDLNMQVLSGSAKIDMPDNSADAAVLSTVLCSIPEFTEQNKVFKELTRVLKPGGHLYVCDFLITESSYYLPKYAEFADKDSPEYGLYKTQDTFVRHHYLPFLLERLNGFEIRWLIGRDSITMNGHPVKSFHLIAIKK